MNKDRQAEIKRLEEAIKKSKSPYLKRDYQKRIDRIRRNNEHNKNS